MSLKMLGEQSAPHIKRNALVLHVHGYKRLVQGFHGRGGRVSREYRGKRIVLWPANIDSTLSRSEGRKIPRKEAVRKPRVEEIVEAAKRLGLNPSVEDARYPRKWWEQKQRVVVDRAGMSKIEVLKMIAREVERLREEKARRGRL